MRKTKVENRIVFRGIIILADNNEIVKDGLIHKLKPKEMDVLVLLHKFKGHTLSRDFILDKVWSDSYGNDLGLTQAVSKLRKVFDDDPKTSRVIKTISKKGYQLLDNDHLSSLPTMTPSGYKPNYLRQSLISSFLTLIFISLILLITFLTINPKIRIRVQKEALLIEFNDTITSQDLHDQKGHI